MVDVKIQTESLLDKNELSPSKKHKNKKRLGKSKSQAMLHMVAGGAVAGAVFGGIYAAVKILSKQKNWFYLIKWSFLGKTGKSGFKSTNSLPFLNQSHLLLIRNPIESTKLSQNWGCLLHLLWHLAVLGTSFSRYKSSIFVPKCVLFSNLLRLTLPLNLWFAPVFRWL